MGLARETVTQLMGGVAPQTTRQYINRVMRMIGDRLASQSHTSAGLVIKAGGSPLAKTGAAAWFGTANGVPVTIAAATDMPALVGTTTNALFNVYVFYIDAGSTVTTLMGKEGAALANVVFPVGVEKKAMIGYIIINPTGTGNFVGGTTDLDDATVVPTAVYVNTIGALDPTVLLD